jgi:intracellular septation protein A
MDIGSGSFLTGLLPLVVFVVIDAWSGVKAGVVSAVVLALGEALYTYSAIGGLDEISLVSLALVVFFGGLSFYTKHPIYMKMQPVALGTVLGFLFLLSHCFYKPVLLMMMDKYAALLPTDVAEKFSTIQAKQFLVRASLNLGWGFLFHALAVAYAALYMTTTWWLSIRVAGLYLIMFLCMLLAR